MKRKYFNPFIARKYDCNEDENFIKIKCYSDSGWECCPNPNNFKLCKEKENEFKMGLFIKIIERCLPREQFNNPKNWN